MITDIRRSGILLHITSLPSPYGIGDLGPTAHRFCDFLAESGQSFWQILPLHPISPGAGNSPYHSTSAFGLNTLLISPEGLVEEGLLDADHPPPAEFPVDSVDYRGVIQYKELLFDAAYRRFLDGDGKEDFRAFCADHAFWLEDHALFSALLTRFAGKMWSEWPSELRDRDPGALNAVREEIRASVEREMFLQYAVFRQWQDLHGYCNRRGIRIIGDIPIYVSYNSADVWAHPELFKLDGGKRPYVVAGVPPDYFSSTGQLWGNPVYRWDVLREQGYRWWTMRVEQLLRLVDLLRIDHFRGFSAYWEVPADRTSAVHGSWVTGPGEDLFLSLARRIPALPFIAEDLGVVTPDVGLLMQKFGLPGMRVLLFAFNDASSTQPHLPEHYIQNCVAYTGTHDNNTARGWFETEASDEQRQRLFTYLGRAVSAEEISGELVRLILQSVANTAILPMQDLLGLGAEARMNRPAGRDGNWQWRLRPGQISFELRERLQGLTAEYGRTRSAVPLPLTGTATQADQRRGMRPVS